MSNSAPVVSAARLLQQSLTVALSGPGGKDLDVDVLRVGLVREHWDGISGSSRQEVELAGSSTAPARHAQHLVPCDGDSGLCQCSQVLGHPGSYSPGACIWSAWVAHLMKAALIQW